MEVRDTLFHILLEIYFDTPKRVARVKSLAGNNLSTPYFWMDPCIDTISSVNEYVKLVFTLDPLIDDYKS